MIHTPPSLLTQIEIFVDENKRHIHILEITDRTRKKRGIQSLIQEISKHSNTSATTWSWIYYGQGNCYGVSLGICTRLTKEDSRLYKPYKSKMYLAAPFRNF